MHSETETITEQYQALKNLKNEHVSKYGKIEDSSEATDQELITKVKRSLASLRYETKRLNQRLWPFKELPQPELKEQYQSQKETLQSIGLLTELSPQTLGLSSDETIDGQSYLFPSFEEIKKTMIKNKDILSIKINQGFNQLRIVPIALKLSVFQDKINSFIKTKHSQSKLLGTKTPRGNEFIELNLNANNSIYILDDIINGEQSGDLLYHIQQFDNQHHGGLTKPAFIKKLALSPFPGFEVLLIPPDIYLPKEREGEIKGEGINQRKQLENNDTSVNYLKTITNPDSPYHPELGLTIEVGLIDFASYLANTNHVKYDWNDSNCVWLIANYLKSSNKFSGGGLGVGWSRGDGRLHVVRRSPDSGDVYWGCLSAVRLFLLQ